MVYDLRYLFFFSSRRRHTRLVSDWSSDVCSSDLYRLIYERPVPPPCANTPEAIQEFTQRCTDVLEVYVRRHPELWLWMHRRWRDPGRVAPPTGAALADEFVDVDG